MQFIRVMHLNHKSALARAFRETAGGSQGSGKGGGPCAASMRILGESLAQIADLFNERQ